MIDLNCKALVYITMNTLDYMSKGSKIINLGSASSFFPLINLNAYAATKAYVVHYSNALHDELKDRGISNYGQINSVIVELVLLLFVLVGLKLNFLMLQKILKMFMVLKNTNQC